MDCSKALVRGALAASAAIGLAAPAWAEPPQQTQADHAIKVKPIADARLRYESVEQAGFASSADALTNRLRAGFQTAPLKGTAFLAEAVLIDEQELPSAPAVYR